MSVLYDYFLAASDEEAGATLDWEGGPTSPPPSTAALDALPAEGIEPVVMLRTLEELLTGRAYDDIDEIEIIGSRNGDSELVVRLPETFQKAIAQALPEKLQAVVEPWCATEEFWGRGDPEWVLPLMNGLADLSRKGLESGRHLYCWICV